MASGGLIPAAVTALQNRYTASKTATTAAVTAGVTSTAAAERATQQELQLVTTREQQSPLV